MSDRYEVFKGDDEQWYFHRKADNNEVVASSEGYVSKDGAMTEAHRQADPEGMTVEVKE